MPEGNSKSKLAQVAWWSLIWLVGLFAGGLSFDCGRDGYMPLDQSIVWDGAWRVLCGDVPYRDFVTPNGLTPIYLQALFFRLGGVSWESYLAHAALANAAFAWLVIACLRSYGSPRPVALLFGALSAVVFYPPIGVPYMEQHAFLFSLAALVLARVALCAPLRSRVETWAWVGAAFALVAAWFSKQIPSAFAVPLVAALPLVAGRERWTRAWAWMGIGLVAALAALAGIAWSIGVDFELARVFHLELAAREGEVKQAFLHAAKFFAPLLQLDRGPRLATPWLIQLAGALALAFFAIASVNPARARSWTSARTGFGLALLAFVLMGISQVFVGLTNNDWPNGVPWLFLSQGLIVTALMRWRAGTGSSRGSLFVGALALVWTATSVRDALEFHTDVNRSRRVNDFVNGSEHSFDRTRAAEASSALPSALSLLRWQLPLAYERRAGEWGRAQARDLRDLTEFLAAQDRDFLLLSDFTLLHALSGKRAVTPNLWFHPGLVYPRPDDAAWPLFERLLLEKAGDPRVGFVVLGGTRTWASHDLAQWPALAALVEERKLAGEPRRFGSFFSVIELAR